MEPRIGLIYKFKVNGDLTRIIRAGGAGFYTGRGCTPRTATPDNHIRAEYLERRADLDEIERFLELEMKNGMVAVINAPTMHSKGNWVEEVSSGYLGFRCKKCATWVYANRERRCDCD